MKQVRLHVGEACVQDLRLNAGTGYAWEYRVEGDEYTVELEKQVPRLPFSEIGGAMRELFNIHAMHPGTAVVHFELRRSWEGPAAQNETVKVIVVE